MAAILSMPGEEVAPCLLEENRTSSHKEARSPEEMQLTGRMYSHQLSSHRPILIQIL